MKLYFSPETGGFYPDDVFGPRELAEPQTKREIEAGKRARTKPNPDCRIPGDAIEITLERHEELMAAQAGGKTIVARGGKPVAVEFKPTEEERQAHRRAERDRRLAASDWTQLPDSPIAADERSGWAVYRQELRDLDMGGVDWPEEPDFA